MKRAILHHIASDFGINSSIGYRSKKICQYSKNKFDITIICRSSKNTHKQINNIWTLKIVFLISRVFALLRIYGFQNIPGRKYELFIFNSFSVPLIFIHYILNRKSKRYFHSWDTSYWLLFIVKKLNYIIIKDCAMNPSKISLLHTKIHPKYYLDKTTKDSHIKNEKNIFDISEIIISPSTFTSNFIINEYQISPKKLKTIPFGVNHQKFETSRSRSSNNRNLRIGFVGVVNMRKGIRWLINDLNRISESEQPVFELHLFGRIFNEEKNLLNNLKFKIFKHGFIDTSKNNIYKLFDVLIHPSFIEGSAKCIYEAMASGLPIICTKESGSIVENKRNGFVIKAGNSENLINSIEYFLKNKEEVIRMGNESIKIVKDYSWERYAKNVTDNYLF